VSEELQPVTWLKQKYSCYKQKGRYKGGTNAAKSVRKRKKVGGGPSPIEHVLVLTASGHKRWDTRPRETGKR
jgi:hypothetical protein